MIGKSILKGCNNFRRNYLFICLLLFLFIFIILYADIAFAKPSEDYIGSELDKMEDRLAKEEEQLAKLVNLQIAEAQQSSPEAAAESGEQLLKKTKFMGYELYPADIKSKEFVESSLDRIEENHFNFYLYSGTQYDDNISHVTYNRVPDWIFTISPTFKYHVPRGDSYLDLFYQYGYNYYEKTAAGRNSHQVNTELLFKPYEVYSLKLKESFLRTQQVSLRDLDPVNFDIENNAFTYINTNDLSLRFSYMPWRSIDLINLLINDQRAMSTDDVFVKDSQIIEVDYEHFLDPTLSIFLGGGWSRNNFKLATQRDYNAPTAFTGINYQSTDITKFGLRFSLERRNYDDDTRDLTWYTTLNLEHQLSRTLKLRLSYDYGDKSTALTVYRKYNINAFHLDLNYTLNPKSSLLFKSFIERDTYLESDLLTFAPVGDKKRMRYGIDISYNYLLTKNIGLNLDYNRTKVDSDFINETYIDNTYQVGINFRF